MKNRLVRLVAVVLLSAMAGVSLAGTNPMLGSKRSVMGVSMDYPAESDVDASLFSDKDMKVRSYLYNRTRKRSGTYLLTKDGRSVDEADVKALEDAGKVLRNASSVITEVILDRSMSREEEDGAIANAAREAFKKTWQYGEWKFRMKKQIEKSSYTNEDIMPGYLLVRGCSGHTSIYRINPKRMYSGEMRDVTSGTYYNDRKNSFLRDRRFLNAADSISAAKNDPEYDRMVQAIDNTWTLQGDIASRSRTESACPNASPLYPELDSVACGDAHKTSGVLNDKGRSTGEKVPVQDTKIPDLSKLVDLLKQTMEQLRKINAKNSKPSDKDFKDHNMLVGEACNEVRKIGDEVRKMHLSEQERIRMGEELDRLWGEKIKQYCKTIEELRKQIEAKGYGHFENNFNFDPKSFK